MNCKTCDHEIVKHETVHDDDCYGSSACTCKGGPPVKACMVWGCDCERFKT